MFDSPSLIGLFVLCVYAAYTIRIYYANQQAANAAHDTLVEIQKQYPEIKKSAGAARDAANTAERSLISIQRAFVTFQRVLEERGRRSPNGEHFWDFYAIYENSGVTPAVTPIGCSEVDRLRGDPSDARFDNCRPVPLERVIAPKATEETYSVTKPESFIFGHDLGYPMSMNLPPILPTSRTEPHIHIWGWVAYRDIFDIPHLTEFCKELTGIDFNPPIIGWTWRGCGAHSCTDQYCQDFDELTKNLLPVPKPRPKTP